MLATALVDLKTKFENRSFSRASAHEMLSIYIDLLLNIKSILKSDARIASKFCEKSDVPIIVTLAELFDLISNSEKLMSEESVEKLLYLCTYMSVECAGRILKCAFHEPLKNKKGFLCLQLLFESSRFFA